MSKKQEQYWKSLNQLYRSTESEKYLEDEFPENSSELHDHLSRRRFLSLMGASAALAGLSSCRRPVEKIVPYIKAPENWVPGIPQTFATTMPFGVQSWGILVQSHDGRPTKIEGNPHHPASLGGTNVYMQAAILGLYDPDRSDSVLHNGARTGWEEFVVFWREQYRQFLANRGRGLAIISESFASPTIKRLYNQFNAIFPLAQWVVYEPISNENIYAGLKQVTGMNMLSEHQFDRAKIILALDSDFLQNDLDNVRHAHGFSRARNILTTQDEMNRLYAVESLFTATGAMADHRLRIPSSQIGAFLIRLAQVLKENGANITWSLDADVTPRDSAQEKWIAVLADDLLKNQGESIVLAGGRQAPWIHALVFLINEALKNNNQTIFYFSAQEQLLPNLTAMKQLRDRAVSKEISTLLLLGGNPLYNTPADIDVQNWLPGIPNTLHLSPYIDETSQKVGWHIPQSHFLESWGDAVTFSGVKSVLQPLIQPLFNGKSPIELLNLVVTGRDSAGYEVVRETWSILDLDSSWQKVLHDGIDSTAKQSLLSYEIVNTSVLLDVLRPSAPSTDRLEINFYPSTSLFDGRFANNGWLQELPDGITRLAWDNAALVSPRTAKELRCENFDVIDIVSDRGEKLAMPVWIVPGHADFTISIALGYGRVTSGRVSHGVGTNAYPLRTLDGLYFSNQFTIEKTGKTFVLANTQDHGTMAGRPIIRETTLEEYRAQPHFASEMVEHPPLKSLWKEHQYTQNHQWGMLIDLNLCVGCNACVIACQSENNIPIVGKDQVINGREMHWLRLDRYFVGDPDDPQIVHQPVACQHCEMAPCEQVCPVAATVHDKEGLNLMVYNRCVGTRYCSNNCPYKVRRFNFFNYTSKMPEVEKMAQNPEVSVRSRGVMEKCTYCLQRINHAKWRTKKEGREIADDDLQTACQQACPAKAIFFGNLQDAKSRVVKMKQNDRAYALLAEYNLRPRTLFLAKLRNPNPRLAVKPDRV